MESEEVVIEVRFATREEALKFHEHVMSLSTSEYPQNNLLGNGTMTLKPYYPNYWMKDVSELVLLRLKSLQKKFISFVSSTLI